MKFKENTGIGFCSRIRKLTGKLKCIFVDLHYLSELRNDILNHSFSYES